MKYFFCKLIPPRPDFNRTMSIAEAKLMQDHAAYLKGIMEQGKIAAFGPVADPKGAYGVAILTLGDDDDVHTLTANDPTIKANVGFLYEIYPMPRAVVRP